MLNSAEIIIEVFKKWGVEKIFGTPSKLETSLIAYLRKNSQIEYIPAFEDHLALSLATGFAQLSGKVGVVNLGTPEGVLNSLGFIKSTKENQIPLVIISPLPTLSSEVYEPDHDALGLTDLAGKYCKWSWKITSPDQVAYALEKAMKISQTPPSGPTFISIPKDVFLAKSPKTSYSLHRSKSYKATSSLANTERVSLVLLKAKNPVIIAGALVATYKSQAELAELTEILGAPVISESPDTNSQVLGVNLQYYHPYYLGFYYHKDQAMKNYLKNADCILEIGTKVNYSEMFKDINPRATIIHAADNPDDLGKHHVATYALVGDIKNNLTELINTLKRYQWPYEKQLEKRKKVNRVLVQKNLIERQKVMDKVELTGKIIKPLHLIKALNEVYNKETIFVDESQTFSSFLKRFFRFIATHEIFSLVGGQKGWGLPFAIGGAFSNANRKRLVCLVSEASFIKSLQSLLTLSKYKLPLIIIVTNNKGFASLHLEYKKAGRFDKKNLEFLTLDKQQLNLETVTSGLGIKTFSVTKPQEIKETLEKANSLKAPVLVEVVMTDDLNDWSA